MNMNEEIKRYTGLVDNALKSYLPEIEEGYRVVNDAMIYSVFPGGKRIRPVLTLAVCEMLGGDPSSALPLGCAVECIHASSLIHDDLPCMDDDELRRGKPSCHIKFGEANALLSGDALIVRAFEIMCGADISPKSVLKSINILTQKTGIHGMIGGQVLDLAAEGKHLDYEELKQMHLLKTGALIEAACLLGAVAADACEEDLKALGEYARHLGLAFQICDDILDVEGDEALLGKPIGSDEKSQKSNFISLFGVENSKEKAKYHTDKALSILSKFPRSQFLEELTLSLLKREN